MNGKARVKSWPQECAADRNRDIPECAWAARPARRRRLWLGGPASPGCSPGDGYSGRMSSLIVAHCREWRMPSAIESRGCQPSSRAARSLRV